MKRSLSSSSHKPVRRTSVVFPSYRYVPGRFPHPIKHPDGHMYENEPQWSIADSWGTDPQFLYAADLFDHGYYWEAHEQWEACWKRATGRERLCIQGLIKVSASILKHNMGHLSPRDLLLTSGAKMLACHVEIDWNIGSLIEDTKDYFIGGQIPCLPIKIPKN